jgi:hypothetical protein
MAQRYVLRDALRRLDHRPSRAAQGADTVVGTRLIPNPPIPNQLIGSSEHNWLTGKVLLTAVRVHSIGL